MFDEIALAPAQASTVAPRVDAVFAFVTGVGVVFTLLVFTLVAVFAVRYRRRSEAERPRPIFGSVALEATWSLIPLALMLVMFGWGASVYFELARPPDDALNVFVVGRRWMWKLQHPGGQWEVNELHVPAGRPVRLTMTSEDVIHSFYVPAFRTKADVVPGRYSTTWFEATRVGTYHLFCAEYCGTWHSRMIGTVHVLDPADYQRWLTYEAARSPAALGRQLFTKLQCVACHNAEGETHAPLLEELYGKRVPLADGRTVAADENYLRESIRNPKAKVVLGYRPIMPAYGPDQVSEEELFQLIAFLRGLGRGETPPRVEETPPPVAPPETPAPEGPQP